MKKEFIINADACYRMAEQKAAEYFQSLAVECKKKSFVPILTIDIQSWKQNHIHSVFSFFSRGKGRPDTKDYQKYIQWLDYTGKLDSYLDRSISYLFMRDLGKNLNSLDTKKRVRHVVENLKNHLTHLSKTVRNDKTEMFSLSSMYRKAQEEGLEATFIWLIEKLKTVSSHIPEGMDAEQAQRKLIKIIAGVLMHVVEDMDDEISPKERTQKLDEAIRLGYSYGLTYPFIDDLLDAKILSSQEEKQYSDLIRTTLITGTVQDLDEWAGNNKDLINYIHSELREAFDYIKTSSKTRDKKKLFRAGFCVFSISGRRPCKGSFLCKLQK